MTVEAPSQPSCSEAYEHQTQAVDESQVAFPPADFVTTAASDRPGNGAKEDEPSRDGENAHLSAGGPWAVR